MPIAFNEMETRRFGIRCARVEDPRAPLTEINAAAQSQEIAFLSVRVATDDIAIVQALEEDGYRLMDTLVYYDAPLSTQPIEPRAQDDIEIRAAAPQNADCVGKVAAAAFSGFFGHYHADTRLSQDACDAIYVDWAKNCVMMQTRGLPVLVAQTSGKIVGFLAARQCEGTCANITLNAISPPMQGRGIYGALLDGALQIMAAKGYQKVTISTQINNIAVQRSWGRRGFRLQRSFYTLHKWIDAQDP
ncbi:GNAT family N-acetyltransferase [Marimonas sp. MJW-29]|uniref:GNAT family N-acetyltransferase n=1 Tax=Sulfitobacter sediminis TaxID=3234186 RepID=A0ABV3RQN8_9RHOB